MSELFCLKFICFWLIGFTMFYFKQRWTVAWVLKRINKGGM
ncbi:hypothetical protein SAMN05661086_02975 [Anaeromicropila populeti]|uniref:Uncharacterized protein n=1 Tax=Anaeromicropila populeti TaxID=37658 RepID=A0A1I6L144_9FIRM|nr:hypothetical protein SAMN05661086_02975 [Anaeromicropila populeti]